MRPALRLPVITAVAGLGLAAALAALAVPVAALVRHGTTARAVTLIDLAAVPSERSVLLAADGKTVLAVLHAAENRQPVTIDRVPPTVVNAVLDTEDARFWTHGGFDLRSTVRALVANVHSGGVRQGGSTITQQLVKNALLTPQRNLDRKIKEAAIAVRVERKYTKSQILEAYLNTIYLGNGAYGVQAAAEEYFNEDISQVTDVQAALMAGMIRNPQGYDPLRYPRDATVRRNFVLDRMVAEGHLTADRAAQVKALPVPSAISAPPGTTDTRDDYYVEEVKQQLLGPKSPLGTTYQERYNTLFRGGLRIYTNLDSREQKLAEDSVNSGVPKTREGFTASLVSLDTGSSRVRALVGGPGFDRYKFDLATQALRQPGSSFKIFTLLAALESGYGPNDTIDGSSPCPLKFPNVIFDPQHVVHNNEGEAPGVISLTAATAGSVNCAYLRLAHEVGLSKVVDMAHRFGVGLRVDLGEKLTAVPTLVIGAEEVTNLEMAAAYAAVANDGVWRAPLLVDHIDDRRGKQVFKFSDTPKRVVSTQIARQTVNVLRSVVTGGTGTAAQLYGPYRAVAGKTGTTEHNTDAWFDGFTPQLTTTVWMGDPKAKTPMLNVGSVGAVYGGTYPARIWHDYMQGALSPFPAVDFTAPDWSKVPGGKYITSPGLVKDSVSGLSGPYGYNPYGPYPTYGYTPTTVRRRPTTTVGGGPGTTAPGPPTSPPPTSPPPTSPPTTHPPPTTGAGA